MTPQNLLHEVLPQAVTHALGWTLLHSLWQGALLALLLAVLLRLMHRHTAAFRYQVAWGGLMGMLLLSVITYCTHYETTSTPTVETTNIAPSGALQVTTLLLTPTPEPSLWEKVITQGQAYFDQHLPAIVLLWLVGMLLMGLRLLGGWVYVQRLRSYRLNPVPLVWVQKAQELSKELGISKAVKVAESALIQVPMTLGYIKPLVLLPLGTLAGLSAGQIEAILAHELAHVKRHDYLLNLLQSIVETLFFFHPAVWWMSDCIRTEREHACDDLALSLCGDPLTYAHALTNLEELTMKKNSTSPRLAMAFSGHRRSLLSRITRLVQRPALRPSFSEGFLASCAILTGLLIFSASASANFANSPGQSEEALSGTQVSKFFPVGQSLIDSTNSEEELILQQLDNDLVIVKNKKGKVVEVYVNGQRIPKSEISKYQSRIDQQLAAAKNGKTLRNKDEIDGAMEQVEASLERLDGDLDRLAPLAPMPPLPPLPFDPNDTAPVPPVPPVPPLPNDEKGQKAYEQAIKRYEARMKEFETRMEAFVARTEALQESRIQEHEARQQAHASRMAEHNKQEAEHDIQMEEHEKQIEQHNADMKKHDAMMKALNKALVADKLIKSEKEDYDLELNKNGLFFNDKKQSNALFEKYKKIMQKATGDDINAVLKERDANFRINNSSNSSTTTKSRTDK